MVKKKVYVKNPKHNRKKNNWDSNIPDKIISEELKKVSKNQIIWGGNYFVPHLDKGWDGRDNGLTMSDCVSLFIF